MKGRHAIDNSSLVKVGGELHFASEDKVLFLQD
jgi:hypothetical protein